MSTPRRPSNRFRGWPWVLLPPTLALAAALLPAWYAPGLYEGRARWALLSFCTLLALLGVSAAIRRIGLPMQHWSRLLREAAAGRVENRVNPRQSGMPQELADAINRMLEQLNQAREGTRDDAARLLGHLREELARERAARERADHAVTEARELTQFKSDLLSNMSHELRTPLTAILGFSDLLKKTPLNREQSEYVSTLSKSAENLLAMINSLLDWNRIEAGRLSLQKVSFALSESVDDVVGLLAPLAYDKGLEIAHLVYHDVPLRVSGDPVRLQQILTNLVSNAIKFTDRGEIVIRVMRERSEHGQAWLRFDVSDTGRGIAEEQRARLFEMFTPSSTSNRVPSSGLGLALSKRLAELMDGRLEVQSEVGVGSTFSAIVALTPQLERDSALVTWDGLRNVRLWLCDLQSATRLSLMHYLEYWGMDVRIFETPRRLGSALADTGNGKPALVLAGITPEAIDDPHWQALFASCRGQRPCVALVSSASTEVHQAVVDAGAERCLPKSIGGSALYQTLLDALLGAPAQNGAQPLQGLEILVVDNTTASRRYVSLLIESLGGAVLEAANGREAVSQWRERKPPLILMDVQMPELDGPGAARQIRADEAGAGKRCGIIGMSAHLEPEERQEVIRAGMDEVLLKPFDERQLLRALGPWRKVQAALPPEETAAAPAGSLSLAPELAALLIEELPLQLKDLEDAYTLAEREALRSSAHQIHGTAAFYKLEALRAAARRTEQSLAAPGKGLPDNLADGIADIRDEMNKVLRQLRADYPAEDRRSREPGQ